jgi:hypothetical protein
MRTIPPSPPPVEYQPTAAQEQRAAALRRFNWLYFYLPIILISLGGIALLIIMLWSALPAEQTDQRTFVSALADVTIILTVLPMLLLCAIVPGTAVYLVVHGRKEGWAPLRKLQTLFWRLQDLLTKVDGRIQQTGDKAGHALIQAHGRAAWLRQLPRSLKRQIQQFIRTNPPR